MTEHIEAPQRIAFIAEDFPTNPGGAAVYSANLAAALAEQGHDVRVVAPHVSGDSAFDASYGLPVTRIGECDIRRARLGLMARRQANEKFRLELNQWLETQFSANPPDFAVVSTVSMWAKPCWRRNIPYAVCVHGGDAFGMRADWIRTLYRRMVVRRILDRADLICANSGFTAEALGTLGCPVERIVTTYCGVEPAFRASLERTAKRSAPEHARLLTMTRLVPIKAADILLRAVYALRERHPGVTLTIAGDGPERAALQALARELGIADCVRFVGYVSNVEEKARLFRNADIYVQSGRLDPREGRPEAFGITFAEAGAAALPAVGPRIGGVPEVIAEGLTGSLVEPDNVASLVDALDALLDDPEAMQSMGQRGSERVREYFDYQRIASTVLDRMIGESTNG